MATIGFVSQGYDSHALVTGTDTYALQNAVSGYTYKLMIVTIDQNSSATNETTSVVYNGQTLTLVHFEGESTEPGGAAVYYCTNYNWGGNLVVNRTGTNEYSWVCTTSGDNSYPFRLVDYDFGNSASTSAMPITLDLPADSDCVLGVVIHSGEASPASITFDNVGNYLGWRHSTPDYGQQSGLHGHTYGSAYTVPGNQTGWTGASATQSSDDAAWVGAAFGLRLPVTHSSAATAVTVSPIATATRPASPTPVSVTDLSVTSTTSTTATLSWTDVNDSAVGNVIEYGTYAYKINSDVAGRVGVYENSGGGDASPMAFDGTNFYVAQSQLYTGTQSLVCGTISSRYSSPQKIDVSTGVWDTTYRTNVGTGLYTSTPGVYPYIGGMIALSDGSIIVAGQKGDTAAAGMEWQDANRASLIKVNADGTRNSTFHTNIGTQFGNISQVRFGYAFGGQKVVQFSDESFVFTPDNAGQVWNGNAVGKLVKLSSTGVADTTYNSNVNGWTNSEGLVNALAINSSNEVFMDYSTVNNTRKVSKVNSDGTENTAYSGNQSAGAYAASYAPIYGLFTLSDGSVIAFGAHTTWGGYTTHGITKLTTSGAIDTTWLTNIGTADNSASPFYMAYLLPNDKILVYSYIGSISWNGTTYGKYHVVLNSDGTVNTTLTSAITKGFTTKTYSNSYGVTSFRTWISDDESTVYISPQTANKAGSFENYSEGWEKQTGGFGFEIIAFDATTMQPDNFSTATVTGQTRSSATVTGLSAGTYWFRIVNGRDASNYTAKKTSNYVSTVITSGPVEHTGTANTTVSPVATASATNTKPISGTGATLSPLAVAEGTSQRASAATAVSVSETVTATASRTALANAGAVTVASTEIATATVNHVANAGAVTITPTVAGAVSLNNKLTNAGAVTITETLAAAGTTQVVHEATATQVVLSPAAAASATVTHLANAGAVSVAPVATASGYSLKSSAATAVTQTPVTTAVATNNKLSSVAAVTVTETITATNTIDHRGAVATTVSLSPTATGTGTHLANAGAVTISPAPLSSGALVNYLVAQAVTVSPTALTSGFSNKISTTAAVTVSLTTSSASTVDHRGSASTTVSLTTLAAMLKTSLAAAGLTTVTETVSSSALVDHLANAGLTVVTLTDLSGAIVWRTRYLKPDVLLVETGLTGPVSYIQDSPTSPDGNALTPTGGAINLRMSFEDPGEQLRQNTNDQIIRVRVTAVV
jgi:hypothetical protein